ncbi:succinic semialdehyde dehydrogenase [Calidithermus chliarophilus]|uniref:succinic semialdehyde dehydrogenase n=2 Tax=Calidithermus chliarophilus TaxID=52023 RepID=UPI0004258EB3|nr:succinic semialdehyde dehydrogenase [Calidithermus chliarophilus]
MIETGRLPIVNPPRSGPSASLNPEFFARLARRVPTQSGVFEAVRSPFDQQVLAELPICTPADVAAAVQRAREAQAAWAKVDPRERARVLLRFHDLLLARQEQGLDLTQLEAGKARRHAQEELLDSAINAQYYATRAPGWLRPRRAGGTFAGLTVTWEYRHPVGVVGVICPWNYPLTMAVSEPVAALMAGNAVVLKPDPQTSFTALWVLSLMEEAGLPPGLMQVVTGAAEVGSALVGAVDFIALTGSTRTGRVVARQAGERLIGANLELGGKNPMLVLEDAPLEAAVKGAVDGCFTNAGQLCVSIESIYVHESVYEAFKRRFVEKVSRLRLGSTLDHRTQIGSLTVARQFELVQAHVQEAVAKGAKVLTGGKARPDLGPLFFEPTVLEGVTPEMRVYNEETFGPVVALYPYGDLEEVLERINASEYGLNASVWTRDLAKGRAVASRIQAGTVNVNEAYAAAWISMDATMGGFKASGLGRRHGKEGLYRFTELQTVALERLIPITGPAWLPRGWYGRIVTWVLHGMKWVMRWRYRV